MTDPTETAERLEGIRRALAAVANDRPTPEQTAEWNTADKAMAQRIRAALPGVPLHHAYAVLRALRVMERMGSAVAAPATDQAAPAVWIDDHPQLEAIAAAVWDRCRTEGTSLVVDDPRNIAVAAYTAAFEATVSSKAAPKADSKGATGQAALRDRIRRVLARIDGFDFDSLEPHDYQIQATALLAVLPASVDRADVLLWAADHLETLDPVEAALAVQHAWKDAAAELRRVAAESAPADTGHEDSKHVYLSTGCQHEDLLLPDGRTGHQYCEDMTGLNGAKRPAECKHCGAPCQCPNHAAAKQQPKEA
jgi:hypothetical protein